MATQERRRGRSTWQQQLSGWLLPVVLLAFWELAVRTGWLPEHAMPAPTTVLSTLQDLVRHQQLLLHIAVSIGRVAAGFAIGAVLGLGLGLVVGTSRPLERLLDPTLQAIRSIPSLAWVPLLLLWMGIDEAPKLTLIAIGGFFPVYINTVAGIRGVDRKLVEVGRIYGLSPAALARRIILPSALPSLLTGLRTGLGLSWLYLVAAELIAASKGLGFLLNDGRENSRADIVLGSILLLAVLGKLSDGVLKWLEGRLLSWRDVYGESEAAPAGPAIEDLGAMAEGVRKRG